MVTVKKIAKPGKTTNHQALNCSRPELNKEPQVTALGGTPIPRNDKEDSIKIAEATPKAMAINAGAIPFGKACLKIIRNSLNPIDFAACTYSKLEMRKNSARVRRAIPVHEVNPMITMIFIMDFSFAMAAIEIMRINRGIEIKISIMREIIESTGI